MATWWSFCTQRVRTVEFTVTFCWLVFLRMLFPRSRCDHTLRWHLQIDFGQLGFAIRLSTCSKLTGSLGVYSWLMEIDKHLNRFYCAVVSICFMCHLQHLTIRSLLIQEHSRQDNIGAPYCTSHLRSSVWVVCRLWLFCGSFGKESEWRRGTCRLGAVLSKYIEQAL